MVTYSLKISIENRGQTTADGDMVTVYSALSDSTITEPLRLTV